MSAPTVRVTPAPTVLVLPSRMTTEPAPAPGGTVEAEDGVPVTPAFAHYLNTVHDHIHPLFADTYLASLDALPLKHPANNPKLVTRLEIVLAADGRIRRIGIVKTSGVVAFDVAALDAVLRAQPFGPPPSEARSTDGNVYLAWDLHRDAVLACSTSKAHLYRHGAATSP